MVPPEVVDARIRGHDGQIIDLYAFASGQTPKGLLSSALICVICG
jgi:hypothetical protein